MVARPKDDDGSSSLDAIREAVPPSPRFGERGSGGEGRIVSKTQDVVATPTLSAPSPRTTGEKGARFDSYAWTDFANATSFVDESILNWPVVARE